MATMQKFLVEMRSLENYGAHTGDGKASSGNAHWKLKCGLCYAIEASSRGNAMAYAMAKYGCNDLGFKVFPESVVPLDHHVAEWEGKLANARFRLSAVRDQLRDADMLGLSEEKVDSLRDDEHDLLYEVDLCERHLNMGGHPYWVDGGVAA